MQTVFERENGIKHFLFTTELVEVNFVYSRYFPFIVLTGLQNDTIDRKTFLKTLKKRYRLHAACIADDLDAIMKVNFKYALQKEFLAHHKIILLVVVNSMQEMSIRSGCVQYIKPGPTLSLLYIS